MTPTDFPTLFANIPERSARRLETTLTQIAAFQVEGLLIKAEFEAVKAAVSNAMDAAWEAVIGEGYRWGGAAALSEKERDLAWSLGHPYPHLVPGYLKRAKAFKGESAMRDAMVSLLEEMLPLSQALAALKPLIGKRARQPSKTSIAQEERDAKAMTCQCCARKILAETGEIAHHGYQRPGSGWQTASCYGAKALPFEVDRERLGELIMAHRRNKASLEAYLEALKAEKVPLNWSFTDITTKTSAWSKGKTVTYAVTRETFDEVFAQTAPIRAKAHPEMTYDRLKAIKTSRTEAEIRSHADEIAYQQPRYDGWVQTHKRGDGAWAPI